MGVGVSRGSRQMSWAQALSSNLFTCSSLLSPPFDTLPVQIPLRAASHALSCPRFPSLSSLPSPPRWLLLALSHLFISAHHFSSLQLISLRLHSLFFIPFFSFHHRSDFPAQRSSAGRLCPYKMSPSQTFVPVGTCRQSPVLLVLLAQTSMATGHWEKHSPHCVSTPAVAPSGAD